MTLFLLADNEGDGFVAEFLVAAADRADAYKVVEESSSLATAAEYERGRFHEYPPEFEFGPGLSAASVAARGRGVVALNLVWSETAERFPVPTEKVPA